MPHDPQYVVVPERRPGFGAVVFISALTSAAVSVCTAYVLMRYGGPGISAQFAATAPPPAEPHALVPDITGMSMDAADGLLGARKLRLVVKERRADASAAPGIVIEQAPLAQSRIDPGGEVAVVVSTGPARIA